MADEESLACPTCARRYPPSERFCNHCGMPLVHEGGVEEEPATETHERLRKVKPQYTRGDLVRVAWARNQAEAELIEGMLLEEGIPSMQRRTRGFDVPDFLAGGPRDVLVAESAYEDARALLTEEGLAQPEPAGGPLGDRERGYPLRLLVGLLVGVVLVFVVVWLLFQATS